MRPGHRYELARLVALTADWQAEEGVGWRGFSLLMQLQRQRQC
jgi:hypothetical protein